MCKPGLRVAVVLVARVLAHCRVLIARATQVDVLNLRRSVGSAWVKGEGGGNAARARGVLSQCRSRLSCICARRAVCQALHCRNVLDSTLSHAATHRAAKRRVVGCERARGQATAQQSTAEQTCSEQRCTRAHVAGAPHTPGDVVAAQVADTERSAAAATHCHVTPRRGRAP